MSGKGSRPRPFSVDQKTFDSNWNEIFKRKEKVDQENKRIEDELYDIDEIVNDPDRVGN